MFASLSEEKKADSQVSNLKADDSIPDLLREWGVCQRKQLHEGVIGTKTNPVIPVFFTGSTVINPASWCIQNSRIGGCPH